MATITGTAGNDTITPGLVSAGVTGGAPGPEEDLILPLAGRNLVDAGGGNDRIESLGADTVEGGAGFDTWRVEFTSANLSLTRSDATSLSLSNGATGTGIEQLEAVLGANASVTLGGGVAGSQSLIQVASGRLILDWSAKATDGFINLDNSLSYGNIANTLADEVLNLTGFTSVRFTAGSGNDQIRGLAEGASTLSGGAGNDAIWSTGPLDRIDGGEGVDRLNLFLGGADGVRLVQTSATSFSVSNGARAIGVETYAVLLGAEAEVLLRSGGAPGRFSEVSVASGQLTLDWSAKTTGSYVDVGDATSFGDRSGNGLGDEVLSLYGFTSATLRTGAGDDVLIGTDGVDVLRAGAGNDQLVQTGGQDLLFGGLGDDLYFYGIAGRGPIENAGEGIDEVIASVSFRLGPHVENLSLFGTLGLTGVGHGEANRLRGAEGADRLEGREGEDTLVGGAGADRLLGGAGRDLFLIEAATDGADRILDFSPGEDRIGLSAAGLGGGLVAGAAAPLRLALDGRADGPAGLGQLIFETDAGRLWWDADGQGGAGSVLLATLSGITSLAAADLLIA